MSQVRQHKDGTNRTSRGWIPPAQPLQMWNLPLAVRAFHRVV